MKYSIMPRRTPRGVRGLKLVGVDNSIGNVASHPARGAWIETLLVIWYVPNFESHPARGAWIETPQHTQHVISRQCRTPRGVRGLKQKDWHKRGL